MVVYNNEMNSYIVWAIEMHPNYCLGRLHRQKESRPYIVTRAKCVPHSRIPIYILYYILLYIMNDLESEAKQLEVNRG